MNAHFLRFKNARQLGQMIFLLAMACGLPGSAIAQQSGLTRWQEEALQPGGGKIIVERSVQRGGRSEPNQQPPISQQSLAFSIPGTAQKLVWEDQFSQDLGMANFNALMVGVIDGRAYVVASPAGCLSYNKWGRPNPPYVVFKHEAGSWHRIGVDELPSVFELPNLVSSNPDSQAGNGKANGGLISAEIVSAQLRGYGQPEYRRILRAPIEYAGGERCGQMVPTATGRWIGLDFFTQEQSYAGCLKVCAHKNVGPEFCPCANLFKAKQ